MIAFDLPAAPLPSVTESFSLKVPVLMYYIEISPEVDHDSSLAVPILSASIQKHPNVKAIGTQHGNVTAFIGKALEQAGKKPGAVTAGGIDLRPCGRYHADSVLQAAAPERHDPR